MFSGIDKELVPIFWSEVSRMLGKVLKRDPGRDDLDNIYDSLLGGVIQLWCGFEGDTIEIVVLTKIVYCAKKKILRVLMLSGSKLYKYIENLDIIMEWGTKNECASIEFTGRKGFRKILRHLNFKETLIFYEAPL